MSMTRPSMVRQALESMELKPSKSLGQNFLIDGNIRDLILRAARVGPADHVLEVGPGLGALTEVLLEQARQVTLVEKDERLYRFLQQHFAGHPRLTIHHGDVLEVGVMEMIRSEGISCMVSNLPYRIASRLLVDLFRMETPLERIVVTIQADVAEKIAARPSSGAYGPMAVWGQRVYGMETVHRLKPTSFHPRPRVESICLLMERHPLSWLEPENTPVLDGLLKTAFAQRRKTMFNALLRYGLTAGEITELLEAVQVSPMDRPEDVGLEQWETLARFCRVLERIPVPQPEDETAFDGEEPS